MNKYGYIMILYLFIVILCFVVKFASHIMPR